MGGGRSVDDSCFAKWGGFRSRDEGGEKELREIEVSYVCYVNVVSNIVVNAYRERWYRTEGHTHL
jgi:hypothetical protein